MLNQPLSYLIVCFVICSSAFSQGIDSTHFYYQQVIHPSKTSHLPTGYFYYVEAADTHLKRGDTLAAIDAQRMAVIASFKLGTFTDSEQKTVQALQWLDALTAEPEIKNSRYTGFYNLLGMMYRTKHHYDKAFDYYSRALAYVETGEDSIGLLNNRGNVYLDMKNYPLAEQDFRQAIAMGSRLKDTVKWARALNNLGVLQHEQHNSEGSANIRSALQLREKIGDLEGIYSSNRHLALFALSERDTTAAETFATQTLIIANELNSPSYLLESLSILMDLKNDTLVARYKILTDSITLAKQEEQNLYAAMLFDVEKEVLNTRQAELQLEKERSQKTFLLIIGLLLLFVFILVIILILSRIKHIKQGEVFKTESRISKKVHDEVANEVYQVMVKMQVSKDTGEEVLDDLEHIYNKSRDISKEFQVLDTTISFDETITDLLSSYQSDTVKIIRRDATSMDWSKVSSLKKNSIYRVLQELMTNMKKHSGASLVAVTLSQNKKKVVIHYSDNGVGTRLKKQNGLQNAENRIFTLKGSITFETQPNKGFKATITL